MSEEKPPLKRAITLAGGGPAAGLHIGALTALQEHSIDFQVWALSCIGAWVGIVYNKWQTGDKARQTGDFFRDNIFRDDNSYSGFPINTVFGPDLGANSGAIVKFLTDWSSYYRAMLPPEKIADAFRESLSFWADLKNWDPRTWDKTGGFNHWMLDQVLAVNPYSRFLTSLMYLAPVNGLSKIYYADSSFLKTIEIENLYKKKDLFIYHNAWNLDKKELQLFSNIKGDKYKDITTESLCACSALPYIEETITIDGNVYCEGALIDTVNFSRLLEDHRDLDEIWVSRIVDVSQAQAPRNMTEALGNLCMLFAGSLGDDDVKLFKYHAKDEGWKGTIYELNVASDVNFDWSYSNLEKGINRGRAAVGELLNFYFCIKTYLCGNFPKAETYANSLTREDYALGQVARAVTFHNVGKTQKASEAIECLLMTDKVWHRYPALELGKTFYIEATVERLMSDLRAAGLR